MNHQQSSEYLEAGHYSLHLRRLQPHEPHRAVVLMLHGAIENGRIFYSHSGKGLAGFLADRGCLVYSVDFAGRGLSKPHAREGLAHSQHQLICHDIPLLIETLAKRHGCKIHVVAHSWGGVVAVASLIRHAHIRALVASQSYFGSKRRISVRGFHRWLKIDWVWNRLGPWLGRRYGYLPAKALRIGADDEPLAYLLETIQWINSTQFVDPTDGFDYAKAASTVQWMPSLFYAAVKDTVLGHPTDVKLFMQESNLATAEYHLLGKVRGDKVEFDHISMLTHPAALQGHFTELLQFIEQAQRQ